MNNIEECTRYICEQRRIPCHLDLPESRVISQAKNGSKYREICAKLEEIEVKRGDDCEIG